MDKITFARPSDPSLVPRKEINFAKGDGTDPILSEYPLTSWWSFREVEVSSLASLAKALFAHANCIQPYCAVRGEPIVKDERHIARRAFDKEKFGEEAGLRPMHRRWLCFDLDKAFVQGELSTVEGCINAAKEVATFLPSILYGCECIVHFSSTSRNQKVKGHIWLWLPSPVADAPLREWITTVHLTEENEKIFDPALCSPNQPHYLADPLIVGEPYDGWHVAKRWHFLKGNPITKEQMPLEWMDLFEWQHELSRRSERDRERAMASFKPQKFYGNSKERYAEATAAGLADDIGAAKGKEGDRHRTLIRVAYRAMQLRDEKVLTDRHIDTIREVAYGVLPKNRWKEVDRAFENVERSSQAPSAKEMPLKSVKVKPTAVPKANEASYIPDEAIPTPLLPTIYDLARKWKHSTPFWTAVAQAKSEYEARIRFGMKKHDAMADLGRFLNVIDMGWTEVDVPMLVQVFPFSDGREGKGV